MNKKILRLLNWYALLVFCLLFDSSLVSAREQSREKKMVVVIPSYDNIEWYRKNLDSIFNQKYSNWRAIYIDDCSSDGTGQLVQDYVKERGFEKRVLVIRNKTRRLALANLYLAIQLCDYNEIVLTLDGDDWFLYDNVLSIINNAYQDRNTWLTYGSYSDCPAPESEVYEHWITHFGGFGVRPVPQEVITYNGFRYFVGCSGQLRTFYAWLFKSIKLKDFLYKGDFFPMTYDLAIMLPMIEMCGNRFKFIPESLYIHNLNTPLNDHKIDQKLQGELEIFIRKKESYQPLARSRASFFRALSKAKADVIIFSDDEPERLNNVLARIKENFEGIDSCYVIYQARREQNAYTYQVIREIFTDVNFVSVTEDSREFKTIVLETIGKNLNTTYVLFAADESIISNNIDVNNCIHLLEETQSYGFYLGLKQDEQMPHTLFIREGIHAWKHAYATGKWNNAHLLDLALYRKKDVYNDLASLNFHDTPALKIYWADQSSLDTMGLFFHDEPS